MDIQNLCSNQLLKKYDHAVEEYEKCLKNIQDKNNE